MSIELKGVSYTYMSKTPFEKTALSNINLNIENGEYIAIAGHTGSGKSTLIQLAAGLIKPTIGTVVVDDVDLSSKDKASVRAARLNVGIVFQYPETQLFEETVAKDIAFAPKNLNLDEAEIKRCVVNSMKLVGLPYEELKDVSPFDLSGGQKRRVAIAGVLAMQPKYLILDEPTAGLDPKARNELMENLNALHKKQNITIILVSHSMDDIAKFANRVVILSKGRILADGTPCEIFSNIDMLKNAGLAPPSSMQLLLTLKASGFNINTNAVTIEDAEEILTKFIKKWRNTPSFSYGDISRKNLLTLPTNSSKIASAVRLPL